MKFAYRMALRDQELVGEHVVIAEQVLGRRLPAGAIVHHANQNKKDNQHSNLVICPNRAYHNLLHARLRAQAACGNANWLKCGICKKYDAPENLAIRPNGRTAAHPPCHSANQLARWRGNRTDVRLVSRKGEGRRYYAVVAEKAFGGPLPAGVSIFKDAGLVICPSDAYRKLLSVRLMALRECGNVDWRKCTFCMAWDDIANMYCSMPQRTSPTYYHRACRAERLRAA